MPVSFKSDVLPLFTSEDIDHMSPRGVPLNDYSYMSEPANAEGVYQQVSTGAMPLGEPAWSEDKVATLKAWMDDGYQP